MSRYLDIVREAAAKSVVPGQEERDVLLSRNFGAVIEATFRPASDVAESESVCPRDVQFPPCPVCGASRYWISRGLVRCGSKNCLSAPRFALISVEFHPVQ